MGLRARWNLISLRADPTQRQGLRKVFLVSKFRECFARSQSPTNAHGPPLRFALVAVEKANALGAIQSSCRQSFGGLAGTNDVLEANVGALKLDIEANCPRALSAKCSGDLIFLVTR